MNILRLLFRPADGYKFTDNYIDGSSKPSNLSYEFLQKFLQKRDGKKPMLVKRLKTRGREVQQQEYAENALIRDSDLSGGRGGSRIFLGGGAVVSCSTSTPINHIVFFFFFCRIPVVLENRRSFQEGGCAPPAPPPPARSAPALDSALLNNWGREYSSSPWTNLSTLQGGRGLRKYPTYLFIK